MSKYFEVTYPKESYDIYPQKYSEYLYNRFFLKGGKILDAGCSNGKLLSLLNKKGNLDCYGVDLRKEKLVDNSITFKQCNLEKELIPFDYNAFDYVYCKSVISMFHDVDLFFYEAYRVLKPGGKFICLIPDWKANHEWYFDDPTYVRAFTLKGLRYLFEMNGFKNVNGQYFYQLPILWTKYYPLLLPIIKLIAKIVPDCFKWKNKKQCNGQDNKFIRFSKEPMLLVVGEK